MLVKVTNFCSMGCNHCMEDSTRKGQHMSMETFRQALDLTVRLEEYVQRAGIPTFILLSGGECTENPEIVQFVELVFARGFLPILITNGMFLNNPELRDSLLRKEWPDLFVQVTNDPRFYPTAPPMYDDPRITYVPTLTAMLPLGRYKRSASEVRNLQAPTSFNLRSMTRSLRDVREAIKILRMRAMSGRSGHCSPNISDQGDLHAGESRNCWKIGDVASTPEEVTKAILDMGDCNRCGLESGLPLPHKRAIGLSHLYGPNE